RNFLDRALSCLYLEDVVEGTRASEGERFARALFQILDDTVYHLDDIPDEVNDENYPFHLDVSPDEGVDLRLHRYEDGLWRFSSEALQKVTAQDIKTQEVAEENAVDPG